MLRARAVTFGFKPGATFLGPVDLDVAAGTLTAVVGPNGAGKSTLLRLLAGLRSPSKGEIELAGRRLAAYSTNDRARLLAFLPQHPTAPESMRAEEVARLGRYPYRSLSMFESVDDLIIVREVMAETETLELADRLMDTLSGGESQRVHLAAALAQQPRVLLLDEPTSDLDLYHQLSIFHLLRNLAHEHDLAVVVVTHDLNLAMQHCDRAVLLSQGRLLATGAPREVLTPSVLESVYGVAFETLDVASADRPWLLARRSEPPWTDALTREGRPAP